MTDGRVLGPVLLIETRSELLSGERIVRDYEPPLSFYRVGLERHSTLLHDTALSQTSPRPICDR